MVGDLKFGLSYSGFSYDGDSFKYIPLNVTAHGRFCPYPVRCMERGGSIKPAHLNVGAYPSLKTSLFALKQKRKYLACQILEMIWNFSFLQENVMNVSFGSESL